MDGNKLKDQFFEIKSRIERVESDLKEQIADLSDKQEKWNKLEEIADKIKIQHGHKKVRFNIFGKRFTTTIDTLLSAKDSLFYKMVLSNEVDLVNYDEELFFEVDPVMFSHVLDFIRTREINLKRFTTIQIRELRNVAQYFEVTDLLELIGPDSDVYFIKMETSGAYYYNGIVGSNKVEDINDPNPMTGTCATTPGWIILELSKQCDIEAITLHGYQGHSSGWSCENGYNSYIKVSTDKSNWKQVGTIPSGFGTQNKTISFSPVTARYIKFEAVSSYVGLSWVKVEPSKKKRKNKK
jgi:hypothetical protein